MKEVKIETVFEVFEDKSELPKEVLELLQHASVARKRAYAPYSKFLVGAALLLDNGEIITGNNQENASYPSGLCAERTAIFYAHSQFPNATIKIIALTAGAENQVTTTPIPPCGACRQAISEYEIKQDAPIAIYFMGTEGKIIKSESMANLFPLGFDRSFL
ncbi:MAG: cytidine deaminase [Bacteroidota bacterium]